MIQQEHGKDSNSLIGTASASVVGKELNHEKDD
jgi:hypothetical protein